MSEPGDETRSAGAASTAPDGGAGRYMAAPIAPGEIVGGGFRIERTIGAGAMGRVYLARDLRLGRDVALMVAGCEVAAAAPADPLAAARQACLDDGLTSLRALLDTLARADFGAPGEGPRALPGGGTAGRRDRSRGDLAAALHTYRTALARVEPLAAPPILDIAAYELEIGRVLRQLGRCREAMPALERALTIWTAHAPDTAEIADVNAERAACAAAAAAR